MDNGSDSATQPCWGKTAKAQNSQFKKFWCNPKSLNVFAGYKRMNKRAQFGGCSCDEWLAAKH